MTAGVQLYLLRHADAGDPAAWDGPDAVRPLSPKGEQQSERLGRFLAGLAFRPDVILTSPKLRASQTAGIVARHLGLAVATEERLGSHVSLQIVESVLDDAGDPARAMLVGHDPDFSELLAALTGSGNVPMKKSALARIDADRPLAAGDGELRWLVPPDLLKPG